MSNDEGSLSVRISFDIRHSCFVIVRMKLVQIAAPDFDLEKTLNSGQVFHWQNAGAGFVGTIGDCAFYIEQRGRFLRGEYPAALRAPDVIISRYFALDHPLARICGGFPKDETMKGARQFCRGLRIIRQPKWECLAMFICSSMKQVAHIRQIGANLRRRFGEPKRIKATTVFTFPAAERVAQTSEEQLRACALGYRAPNLLNTARMISTGEVDLQALAALPDPQLRERLCDLPGVGAKVANCVMLFAYERLRAFPIDVWIERVLRDQYFAGKRTVTAKKLREFAGSYFGRHGGYAQQYLFHHARMNKPARKRALPKQKSGLVRQASTSGRPVQRPVSSHDKKERLT